MRKGIYVNGFIQLISYFLCFLAHSGFAQDNSNAISLYDQGDFLKAIDACNTLIKAHKHDTSAYTYRGLSKEQIKDYSGARKDFKKLIKWFPSDPRLHFKLGVLWYGTEDYYHSIKEYTKLSIRF